MGWRPSQTRGETPYDIWTAWLGYSKFHAGDPGPEPLTRQEFNEILKSYDPNG